MQLSKSFILPVLDLPASIYRYQVKTYLGHVGFEGESIWGNYLYLQINQELLEDEILGVLRAHPQYYTEFDELTTEIDKKNSVFFVFKFTPMQKMNIVIPFLRGEYSLIDRKYVNTYFPIYKGAEVSTNWRILHKDIWQIPAGIVPLRTYWKTRITFDRPIELPEDAEVWQKPKETNEIYGQTEIDISSIITDTVHEINQTFNNGGLNVKDTVVTGDTAQP